jgi:uncharacterized protein with von Willebrand factor type A (vWA) domain
MSDRHTRGEELLVTAIAGGASLRDAAQQAGVSERTVSRRMADDGFRLKVSHARAQMTDRALGFLANASVQATATLWSLLSSGNERVRLSAARSILEIGPRLREQVELEYRLARLEEAVTVREEGAA